ncbi:MAG: hypothetical protein AAF488_12320 [Planctomycetota bacterium]
MRTILPLIAAAEASPFRGVVPKSEEGETEFEILGGRRRDPASLIENLSRGNWVPVELSMPTGAAIGRSLLIAKMNFFKAVLYSLDSVKSEELQDLHDEFSELVDDCVFSQLAEELLLNCVSNPRNSDAVRRAAAKKLLELWTRFGDHPVQEFPTVLLSAWRARRRVRETYGTLCGVGELVALVKEECEQDFVRFFTRDQVTTDESEAFREFLFGLPYEELQRLQDHMRDSGVPVLSRTQVFHLVKDTLPHSNAGRPSAEEVFASYRRRRIRAEYRSLSSRPGPQTTAEGYLMGYLLLENDEDGTDQASAVEG